MAIITGLSGSGKTTLARSIQSNNDGNYAVISLNGIMKEVAKDEGFDSLTDYFAHYGIEKGFARFRDKLLMEISEKAEHYTTLIDGMYDYELFRMIETKFGRQNMVVVALEPRFPDRIKRFSNKRLSNKGAITEEIMVRYLLRRDAFKLRVGVRAILETADVRIDEPTPAATLQKYQKSVEPLLRS